MKRALAILVLVAMLAPMGWAGAQDDIEGDLPAGPPFDGRSDHASMFDLEQVAKFALAALAGRNLQQTDVAAVVAAALAEHGYGGTRIAVSTDLLAPDRRCAQADEVQTRIRFTPARDGVEVVVASQVWVAALTYLPNESTTVRPTPAGDCLAP